MSSIREERPASRAPRPYGLMSLSDMINCSVLSLCALGSNLMLDEVVHKYSMKLTRDPDVPISETYHKRLEGWLKIAEGVANDFEWKAVHARIKIIRERLAGKRGEFTNSQLAMELRVLRETIDEGLEWQLVYRYPDDKKKILEGQQNDWTLVREKIPGVSTGYMGRSRHLGAWTRHRERFPFHAGVGARTSSTGEGRRQKF
jgi:hypothetical protein